MAGYKVYFRESVEKDFKPIPKKDVKKILSRIESLAIEPRPSGCEKLTGQERYRIRQGEYRIVYSIQDKESTVLIVKIGHRKNVYRWKKYWEGVKHNAGMSRAAHAADLGDKGVDYGIPKRYKHILEGTK